MAPLLKRPQLKTLDSQPHRRFQEGQSFYNTSRQGGPGNETAPSRFQTQALRGKPVREHELAQTGVMDGGSATSRAHVDPISKATSGVEIDTRNMNDLWDIMYNRHADSHFADPPEYITKGAVYKANPSAALTLGQQYGRFISALEDFYCAAYVIAPADRHKFRGRAEAAKFVTRKAVPRYRRTHYKHKQADWWGRASTILRAYFALRKKNTGVRQQRQFEGEARLLVYEGLPTAGAKLSATANLHKQTWTQRLRRLDTVDLDVLQGMLKQAEEETEKALRFDIKHNSQAFVEWLSDPSKAKVGILHKMTKPKPRHEYEYVHTRGKACCPRSIIDAKTSDFKKLWSHPTLTHESYITMISQVREHAMEAPMRTWTLEDFDFSLSNSPDRGKGTDKLVSSDFRRLPCAGRQALVDLFNQCEAHVSWPWQLQSTIIMLQPKPEGDRALGLLPQICRAWEKLTRPTVAQWVRVAGRHWDAALAGSSCLREAAARILSDEISHALNIVSAKTLADIRRFYDTLDPLLVIYAARHLWFPPRVMALEFQLHAFVRFLRQAGCYGGPIYVDRSLVAGSRHANNLARATMYQILHRMHYQVPSVMPRAWFDDVELNAKGSTGTVKKTITYATVEYSKCLAEQGLEMADKSVILTTNEQMTRDIAAEIRRQGVVVKPATTGRDLGIDRAGTVARTRPTHAKRVKTATKRMNEIRTKLRRLHRRRRRALVVQCPTASFLYGTKVYGESPSATTQLRRSAAKAIGKHWSGRCLQTYLDLEQADPAVGILKGQLNTWFDTWCHRPDLHEGSCHAWSTIYQHLANKPPQDRWRQGRGIIGSLILALWQVNWDPLSPTLWLDPDGNEWQMGDDEHSHMQDPTDAIHAVLQSQQAVYWEKASKHWLGQGMEKGIDTMDLRKRINQLRRRGQHREAGVLLATASAAMWSPARRRLCFGDEADDKCSCGEVADDYHRIWGDCANRQDHKDYTISDTLKQRAAEGAKVMPCFWLRGLCPKEWTIPPDCTTVNNPSSIGEIANVETIHTTSGPTIISTDGSGGKQTSDRRYRRCGWSWVCLQQQNGWNIRAAQYGPLPGRRQTNNRAELWAVLQAIRSTTGPLTIYTDSDVTIQGWQKELHLRHGQRRKNADIWDLIYVALCERAPAELHPAKDIKLLHITSHMDAEEAVQRQVSAEAWLGNLLADELASDAAAEHDIPEAQMQCFNWVHAIQCLVWRRLIRAHIDACESDGQAMISEKEKSSKQRKQARSELSAALESSPHLLVRSRCRWQCSSCNEQISRSAGVAVIKHWLKQCSNASTKRKRGEAIRVGTRTVHPSHTMQYTEKFSLWWCTRCGRRTKATDGGSIKGLFEKCQEPTKNGRYVISCLKRGIAPPH